jgi:hypothetical protein
MTVNDEGIWNKFAGKWQKVWPDVPSPYNVAAGGTVTEVPNYNGTNETWRIHEFLADDTLEVLYAVEPFNVVLVAGGGSGGSTSTVTTRTPGDETGSSPGRGVGGGGGGGVLAYGPHSGDAPNDPAGLAIPVGVHPVKVGKGSTSTNYAGSNGGDTLLGTLATALGGGGGGGEWRRSGTNGGSGGGATQWSGFPNVPGKGTPGQGTNGAGGWGAARGGDGLHQPVTITGTPQTLAVGGPSASGGSAARGSGGGGVVQSGSPASGGHGVDGVAYVAYRIG